MPANTNAIPANTNAPTLAHTHTHTHAMHVYTYYILRTYVQVYNITFDIEECTTLENHPAKATWKADALNTHCTEIHRFLVRKGFRINSPNFEALDNL